EFRLLPLIEQLVHALGELGRPRGTDIDDAGVGDRSGESVFKGKRTGDPIAALTESVPATRAGSTPSSPATRSKTGVSTCSQPGRNGTSCSKSWDCCPGPSKSSTLYPRSSAAAPVDPQRAASDPSLPLTRTM